MRLLPFDARGAVFAPLDDGAGRSEAVARRLGGAIALGLLSDGERLPSENDLATALNVSPMTLREALSDLRRRGLVHTRRGRGGGSFVRASGATLTALTELATARLADVGSADLRELGDLHAAVAGTAARLAASRASAAEIARLRDICHRLENAATSLEHRRLDGRYYIELAASAQSVRLARMEMELQVELGQFVWTAGLPLLEPAAAAARRLQVVDAIEARRPDIARTRTEEQIAADTARLVDAHITVIRTGGPAGGRPPSPLGATGAGEP